MKNVIGVISADRGRKHWRDMMTVGEWKCKKKVKYYSAIFAEKKVAYFKKRYKHNKSVNIRAYYQCGYCGFYHLTSSRRGGHLRLSGFKNREGI